MSIKRKIAVVTTTRADYGVMYWFLKGLDIDDSFELQLVVTGTHLSEKFGNTYTEIVNDGFEITEKIDLHLSSDEPHDLALGMSRLTSGFSSYLEREKPDLVCVLGDRFELLPIATNCTLHKTPIAHFNGGEITEGAVDDQIRHAITKLSHVHFTSTEEFKDRVIKLGESPDRVFNVGTLGSENIQHLELFDRLELEKELNTSFLDNNFLVTFHPESQAKDHGISTFNNLLAALSTFNDCRIIFTHPNTDTGSSTIIQLIDKFVSEHPNSISFKNLGQKRYLSVLKNIKAVIGNSSSGIVEAPSFEIATINIGDRQKGRQMAASILNTSGDENEIRSLIQQSLTSDHSGIDNPYQKFERPSIEVINKLKTIDFDNLFYKKFYE